MICATRSKRSANAPARSQRSTRATSPSSRRGVRARVAPRHMRRSATQTDARANAPAPRRRLAGARTALLERTAPGADDVAFDGDDEEGAYRSAAAYAAAAGCVLPAETPRSARAPSS